jgi:hypothetical protein
MTLPTPASAPEQSETPSIEPWLWPVLIAGLFGGVGDCAGAATLYNLYLRVYSVIHPPLWGSRPIPSIASFVSERAVELAVVWAGLFALAYGTQSGMRARLRSKAGATLVTVAFGTLIWLGTRELVNRGNLEEPMLSIIAWLTSVLFTAPAIVWSVRRTAPIGRDT